MRRYEATPKASTELRRDLRRPYYVPGPRNLAEMREFAEYLVTQGVPVRWHDLESFSTDRDQCPYVWSWRIQRGEVKECA